MINYKCCAPRALLSGRMEIGMKILVTGGVGYIGSHTCIELLKAGYEVVVDSMCNSSFESLKRVEKLAGSDIPFYKVDVRDKVALT